MINRIKGLDGIRALSALAVIFTHLHGWKYLVANGVLPKAIISSVDGMAGVQAFFVLSGFLITWLLIIEFKNAGTISIPKFFMRRALRIFPLYILFSLLASCIYLLDSQVTSMGSLYYVYGYAYNFVPMALYTSFLGHTWSLAVEEHFYLLWPLIFLLFYQSVNRLLLSILTLAIIAAPVLHFLLFRSGLADSYFLERWTFIAGYNIAAGCLLAIFLEDKILLKSTTYFFKRKIILVVAAIVYLIPALAFDRSWLFDHMLSSHFRCAGICLLIAWIYFNQESLLVRLLETKALRYLGSISYGLYMYQGLFLATGPERIEGHVWPPSPAAGLLLLVVVTPLSYHFFEKPFIGMKRRFSVISSKVI